MSGRLWQIWTSFFSASTGDFVMYLGLRRAAGHSWGPSLLVQLPSQFPGHSSCVGSPRWLCYIGSGPEGSSRPSYIMPACTVCTVYGAATPAACLRADTPDSVPAPAATMWRRGLL